MVEQAALSDVGRQRDANEDSFVVVEPMFAVADGMGGAQAGEVASQTAAEVFKTITPPDGTPEEQLTSLVAGGQQAHLRAGAERRVAAGDGHHPHRGHG